MNGHFMQYVGEELRNEQLRELNRQMEIKHNRQEALAAQIAARQEALEAQPARPQSHGHGPFGALKVAFLHLAGRRHAPITR